MSRLSCSFCSHVNPEASKFCNECGSPLNLVPCSHCEAINNVADRQCCRCGAALHPATESPLTAESECATDAREAQHAADTRALATDREVLTSSIPVSLADRLESANLTVASPPDPPRAIASEPQAVPAFVRDDDEPRDAPSGHALMARAYGSQPGHRRHALVLVLLLVAVAGAVYWSSMESTQPRARAEDAVTTSATRAASSAQRAPAPASDAGASASQAPAPAGDAVAPATRDAPGSEPPAAAAAAGIAASVAPASGVVPQVVPASEATAAPGDRAAPALQPGEQDGAAADGRAREESPHNGPARTTRATAETAHRGAPHVRTREEAERDALATQRLIARDLGTVPATAPRARPSSEP